MADQDDLLLLHHLRAHAGPCALRQRASAEALSRDPGRAAGKVASWAMGRTVACLRQFSRRAKVFSDGVVPSSQEMRLLEVVRALSACDRDRAERAALWLVPERHVACLLDRVAPLTSFYPAPAALPRRAAQA